ncbi:MAG: response regulator [Butyrivibrio sp.]|nr:response regulator [Butyrivibrio sp.]
MRKKFKILVTGKNRRIAMDICNHLAVDRDYSVIKCAAKPDALLELVPVERPRVIIICLGDERKETVRAFDILKECAKLGALTIIVVANQEDKSLFIKYTNLEKMIFLSRPVSLFALYEKLEEEERRYTRDDDDDYSILSEYINPNSDRVARRHILAVDDNAEQLLQIKEHLKEFYEVTLVGSGRDALKFLRRRKVDLILLDYLMPEMDGPEVINEIRQDPSLASIPVMFLTGVKEKSKVIKTLVDIKPQGYIVKPSKKSELVAKIIDVFEQETEE